MEAPTDITMSASPLREHLLSRPRVYDILDSAAKCKLVYVVAGAGYGKTAAVQHYISRQKNAAVRWLQLTTSDNIGSHYWETITNAIRRDNEELARQLQELGFPETSADFERFTEIIRNTEHQMKKTFLVLDDFHLIQSEKALMFAERCASLPVPGACVIIISRTEPEINTVNMLSRGNAAEITETQLRFTESEIKEFFEKQKISCTLNNAKMFAESTEGWPLAINLLSLVMKNSQTNLSTALKLTAKNINKLFESEAWKNFPNSIQKTLVKLSLVSDLSSPLSREIFDGDAPEKYIQELASFLSYDSVCDSYRIHPLYLDFLKGKQTLLSEEEKQSTYQKAAKWCFENGFFTGAAKYNAKSNDYANILNVFRSYPGKIQHDTYKYFSELLEKSDNQENQELHNLKSLAMPFLLIGMRKFKEAETLTEEVIDKWERKFGTTIKNTILINAYNALAHINKYTCITTHNYKTATYLNKSAAIRDKTGLPAENSGIFALPEIRSFASLVGESATQEDFKRFAESTKDIAQPYCEESPVKYFGYAEWTSCEIAFFKKESRGAICHAHAGVMKAHKNDQHGIEMMLKQYMLRIAISRGDYSLAKEVLDQMAERVGHFHNLSRQLLYDLITGWFYVHIGILEKVKPWIFSEPDKDEAADVRVPMRELIVCTKYYLASKKYSQALAVLTNAYPRAEHERFLFSEIILTLFKAVAELKTDDTESAVKSFEKAYELSYDGIFQMPFVELGKDVILLTIAARKLGTGTVPAMWMESLERKVRIYIKNTAAIAYAYKRENKIENEISLTDRERDLLGDMCRGLSRDEMAEHRLISINTVKKSLQSLYLKLDATNNIDAVRIAYERNLI